MYYVIFGNDGPRARAKAHDLLAVLKQKKPEAELFSLNDETFRGSTFEELIGGRGLFEKKLIVFLDHVFRDGDAKAQVLKWARQDQGSENVFLFLEAALDAKTKAVLARTAEKMQEISAAGEKKQTFQIFSLTDAFGRRDRRSLWVLFQKALAEDASPEEIHGILFWQLKAMRLASEGGSAQVSGLNPFVFRKSLGFAKNYSKGELMAMSSGLVALYHDAHAGRRAFETGLEQFILTL